MKKQLKTSKGFTIIEVVLVLAIAGLIFMMVFIALPALQRSQRDTQRSNDIQRLVASINNFKSNNRGRTPTGTGTYYYEISGNDKKIKVTSGDTRTGGTDDPGSAGTWGYFFKNYLLAGSDTFEDPGAETYGLRIVDCGNKSKNGETCDNDAQRSDETFENQDYVVLLVTNAGCDGETSVYTKGPRNLAAVYKREGGGTICMAI